MKTHVELKIIYYKFTSIRQKKNSKEKKGLQNTNSTQTYRASIHRQILSHCSV